MPSGITKHSLGNQSIGGNVEVGGNVDVSGALTVSGDSTLEAVDIGGKITSPSESFVARAAAQMLCPPGQSGSFEESVGRWYTNVDDVLYLYLNGILPQKIGQGTVYVETITIYCYVSAGASNYVSGTVVNQRTLDYSAYGTPFLDGVDRGKTLTNSNFNYTITINDSCNDVEFWVMEIDVVADTRVDIIGVEVRYKLV